jgi:ribosomal protein L11 methyltransferase
MQAGEAIGEPLPSFETRAVADQDWVRLTQSQFGPIAIGEGFHVVPTWCEPPPGGGIVLRLDPGLAFGTGSHATTRLCLEWLRATLRGGESVLDYGCGSGILAIAAAMLGARDVVGTDIDPQALVASRANAAQNGVDARFVAPDALRRTRVRRRRREHPRPSAVLLAPALAARTRAAGASRCRRPRGAGRRGRRRLRAVVYTRRLAPVSTAGCWCRHAAR